MFWYKNSELHEDINKLKEIANKTEHQKIIEPYEEIIDELHKEIDSKNRIIENLYGLLREIAHNVDSTNMEYAVFVDEPMIQEFDPNCEATFEFREAKAVRIPISKIVAKKINNTMYEALGWRLGE